MAFDQVGPRPESPLNSTEDVLNFIGDREFSENHEIARREMNMTPLTAARTQYLTPEGSK